METQKTPAPIESRDIDDIDRQMDLLERRWHEAAAFVKRADAELATNKLSAECAEGLRKARDEVASHMHEIMRQIEALEDSFLLD